MRNRLRFITVPLLVLSLGLHWTLLQTVAWTGMLITYSRDASFREAVVMTFDGQHPCALCHVVKSGRAEQKKQELPPVNPVTKLDLGLVWHGLDLILSCGSQRISAPELCALPRSYAPPKPRPRFADFPSGRPADDAIVD